VDELSAQGWEPKEVPLYRTVSGNPPAESVDRVRSGDFDILTFTSGSTVRFFLEIVGHVAIEEAQRVVVIGPSTAAVAEELGLKVDAVADPHTTEGVVDAVVSLVGR
ncbi:MAG: uroporphyrinogen-III synthase, partial [Actinobacteria bacterium]|nr:uroporphyrinogen-III synthase [Actinomycetota bacterium]